MSRHAPFVVEYAEGLNGFRQIAERWEGLGAHCNAAHPSLRKEVVQAFLEYRLSGATPAYSVIASEGGRPASALICVSERLPWGGGARQLRALGDLEMYPLPLLNEGDSTGAAVSLIRGALEAPPGFRRLCLDRQTDRALFERIRREAQDLIVDIEPAGFGSYLLVPEHEELFWESLSANFRRNLRRQRKRLEMLDGVHWRFLTGAKCTPADVELFLQLEASGWKGRRGGAILHRPSALAFYRALLPGLAARGCLEMHFLELEGRTIAAQVGVRMHGTLSLLKIAYDESCARVAPGNMLLLELVMRAIQQGTLREINCLTDMPWHQNWAMQRREYVDVAVYPRSLSSMLLAYFPRAVKAAIRESRTLRRIRQSLRQPSQTLHSRPLFDSP